jgi:predicted oxidoreductase (fatty acid repression mutant protein)
MSKDFLTAVADRRTFYGISKEVTNSYKKVIKIYKTP